MALFGLILTLALAQDAIVDLDDKMQLGWTFDGNEIVMYFTCKIGENGYCGIGFGLDMYNTDMIWATDTVRDGWSEERVMPILDIYYTDGVNDITDVASSSENGVLSVNFRRLLDTGDKYDFVLEKNMELDLCFAYYYTTEFIYHEQNYGSGSLVLATEQKNAKFDYYSKYYKEGYEKHAIIMSLSWILLSNIGIIAARYFKWWQPWVYIHIILMTLVLFLTLFSVSKIIVTNENILFTYTSSQRYHSRISLTIAALIITQCILGVITRLFIHFNSSAKPIIIIRKAHHILGWILLIISLSNAYIGWRMYEDENLRALTVFYVIIAIIYFLLELWSKIYSKIDEFKLKRFVSSNEYRILGPAGGYSKIFKSIHRDKRKFVFYDNYLLDIGDFITSHPGGAFIIKQVIGEDVGKYLNGSSSLPGYGPNYHDMLAFSFAKSMAIAELGYENNVLTGSIGQERMEWEIVDKLKVCESTFCIVLSSEEWNLCKPGGFDWMGKHFLLTMSEVNQARRYYSMVLTNLPNWQEHNMRNIRLYIKPYANGKVSRYVTNLEVGSKIILKGPMGPGLMLDCIKPGNYLAFAGGTGILPFVDLVNAVFLNEVPEGFMMSLYVSFSNEDDAFALDLLEAAAEKAPQNFKFVVNISSKGTENVMTVDKIRLLMDGQRKLRKVWICGSSGFSGFIRNMLKTAEVPVKKVINL
ncbi:hypothetical protein SteCoe_23016 [Stentor coeruleus]|uniref:Cytochrome b5 heme-binding domain-containing protein n=1 Tax=Stentor coeruleus TaxID=5963 RepID=A0A1R2BL07_9CILI|nr:hypothetical protein SteCoe_23016 [Stentor coeruleus]